MVVIKLNGMLIDVGPLDGRPTSVVGELLGVRAAQLFVTVESRNAWHNTTSAKYSGQSALYPFLSLAKQHAEDRRKPGSWFSIYETPGLVLYSSKAAAFLADFHSDLPFGKWDVTRASDVLPIGTRMSRVLPAFGSAGFWTTNSNTRGDSLIETSIRLDQWLDPDLWRQFNFVESGSEFDKLTSKSMGSRYKLARKKSATLHRPEGAQAVENAFVQENGRAAVEAAYDEHVRAVVESHRVQEGL